MAQTILIKRGLEADRLAITPHSGELIWVMDTQDLWMGDGTTAGGVRVNQDIHDTFIPLSEKAAINGVATLGADGLVPSSQLPAIKLNNVYIAATIQDMYDLTTTGEAATVGVIEGDTVIVDTPAENYIAKNSIAAGVAGTAADYHKLAQASSGVTSVNGDTGPSVTLVTDDIGEGSANLYYTDTRATSAANSAIQNHIDDVTPDSGTLYSSTKIESLISGIDNSTVKTVNSISPVVGNITLNSGNIPESGNLYYTNGRWITSANGATLSDIGDVTQPTNMQFLQWQTGNGFVGATLDGSTLDITGYVIPGATGSLLATDSINEALGKLEKGLEGAVAGSGELNVNADWDETNTGSDAFIVNKPTLVNSFTGLGDTPGNYGTSGQVVVTKTGGLEYVNSDTLGRLTLAALDDTTITSTPIDDQVLTWDSSTSRWIPQTALSKIQDAEDTPASIGTSGQLLAVKSDLTGFEYIDKSAIGQTTLVGLTDTTITSVTENDCLKYVGGTWVNTQPTVIPVPDVLDDFTDVTVSSPQLNQILSFNGTQWTNSELLLDIASIGDLGDVDMTTNTPVNGQWLNFDGTNWVPAALPSGLDGTFLGLDDVFGGANYTGKAGYTVQVRSAEDGVELVDTSIIDGGTF